MHDSTRSFIPSIVVTAYSVGKSPRSVELVSEDKEQGLKMTVYGRPAAD